MVRLKAASDLVKIIEDVEFQFLMVRLKDITTALLISLPLISIPYGAIKRILIF